MRGIPVILFDGHPYRHPASLPGMADWFSTCCVTIEQRMIGWRIGWVVAPRDLADDVARAHIYNGLTPGGTAQAGALAALRGPAADLAAAVTEYQRRRDAILDQLKGLPAVRPAAGWFLLMETEPLRCSPQYRVTDRSCGPRTQVRTATSRVERLALVGQRLRPALASLR